MSVNHSSGGLHVGVVVTLDCHFKCQNKFAYYMYNIFSNFLNCFEVAHTRWKWNDGRWNEKFKLKNTWLQKCKL